MDKQDGRPMTWPWSPATWRKLLLALLAILVLLLVATIASAPQISTVFEGATVEITADKAWSILPGDCIEISWQLEGIRSLYIDGEGKIGWGELTYCPGADASSPVFRVTAQSGVVREFKLEFRYLPEYLRPCLPFSAILLLFALAIYYLWNFRLNERLPADLWALTTGIGLLACLLATVAHAFTVRQVLESVRDVFASPAWQLLGLVLATLIFFPLSLEALRREIKAKATADFVAIAGFFGFVLLLYVPFGIDSIDQYENWVFRAYLEGRPSRVSIELATRFWGLVPVLGGSVLIPDSFAGLRLVYLLMLWGASVQFYGIQRQLKLPALLAYISTMLFLVYPVNTGLMSLRSIPHTFSKLSLLTAVFLALDYRVNPSRLRMLGIWLALLFSIGSYEAGYVIIAIVPLLWWRRSLGKWRAFNLTAVWYVFPVMKVLYFLLSMAVGTRVYRSNMLGRVFEGERSLAETVGNYLDATAEVYQRTFISGWQEAADTLSQNHWHLETLLALALTGVVALYLAHNSDASWFPTGRRCVSALIGGLLFILPSIGVLLWLDYFNRDLWRMYAYVPIGAAITLLALLLWISRSVKRSRLRTLVVICACLILMLPATSRLFAQHAQLVESANAKANVLRKIVDQAPAFSAHARVILTTDVSYETIQTLNLSVFRSNMFDSAIYMLYGSARPKVAFFCPIRDRCSDDDIDNPLLSLAELEDVSDVVIFHLHDDLSVELLHEIPSDLGIADADSYDPLRLIDASASPPPRAIIMLGASRD